MGFTVGFVGAGLGHPLPIHVKFSPAEFGANFVAKASLGPAKVPSSGVFNGKLAEDVSPATYVTRAGSIATLVPMSEPDPPRKLTELVLVVLVVLIVRIRATKASLAPPP